MSHLSSLWLKIEPGAPNAGTSAHHPNVASDDASGIPQAVATAHWACVDISDELQPENRNLRNIWFLKMRFAG